MKKVKIALYITLLLVAFYYVLKSFSFGFWKGYGPGPGLLPLILGISMIILCVLQLFSKDVLRSIEESIFLKRREWARVSLYFLAAVVTAALMNTLGFLLVTILFSFVVLRYIESWPTQKSVYISLLLPFMLWALFYIGFKVELPEGVLSIIL